VNREDLLAFIRKLYELKCGPRTAYNRAVIVSQLLKANGITKLLHNRDWPEYVEPIRPIYDGTLPRGPTPSGDEHEDAASSPATRLRASPATHASDSQAVLSSAATARSDK
jgi:hypothetical protein